MEVSKVGLEISYKGLGVNVHPRILCCLSPLSSPSTHTLFLATRSTPSPLHCTSSPYLHLSMPVAVPLLRPAVRHFSARRPNPNTRTSRLVSMSCIVSAVVLPFVPPALESSREKSLGYPSHNKWVMFLSHDSAYTYTSPARTLPPLCFHAR